MLHFAFLDWKPYQQRQQIILEQVLIIVWFSISPQHNTVKSEE